MRHAPIAGGLMVLLTAGVLSISPPIGAEPMGRFFHTPQERAVLDGLRTGLTPPSLPLQEEATGAFEKEEAASDVRETPISFQGIVLRSSGRQTIWLNDRSYQENQLPPGVKAPTWSERDRIAIELTDRHGVVTIKPGETSIPQDGHATAERK